MPSQNRLCPGRRPLNSAHASPDILRAALARNVVALRHQAGLTQRAFAVRAELPPNHIAQIEVQKVNATLRTITTIAKAFGVDPHVLLAPDSSSPPPAEEEPAAEAETLEENRAKAVAEMVRARSKPRWEHRSHLERVDAPAPPVAILPDAAIADLAQIIGVKTEALEPHAPTIRDAVAMFVSACRARARHEAHSVARDELEAVAIGTKRLLRRLGVTSAAAPDGPDERFLRPLALGGLEEDEACAAVAGLGRLAEAAQQAHKMMLLPTRAELDTLQLAEDGGIDPEVAVRLAAHGRAERQHGYPVLDILIQPLVRVFRDVTGTQAGVTANAGQSGETRGLLVDLVLDVWAHAVAEWRRAADEKEFPPDGIASMPTGHMVAESLERSNVGQPRRPRGRPKGSKKLGRQS